MSDHFADRLLDAIARKGSPICVGIDPIYEMLPDAIAGDATRRDPNDLDGCIDAIFAFTTKVLQIVAPLAPCVKFQSAYFEKYLWEGVEAYYELIHEAKQLGLIVIGDVKRGDIGSTSEAYAAAHLADTSFTELEDTVTPDAITVNPLLGPDSLEPFIDAAREYNKGLFVLVRTSNPGSAVTQDVKLADGRTWSEMLADVLAPMAQACGCGISGFSRLGAVVGATQVQTMSSLRARLPKSIFLLPGYGTQGATAQMTRAAFIDGKGAIVSASRSILYAHRDPKYAALAAQGWERCVIEAVNQMRADLAQIL
ncbi:orotidine-5'-phosphate decarboxylase [Fontivita pretiosa]|uniref:orotidine-5'-phosphate decarboxylase n=1 Tax=Fontivita pretiosa TaxID=2989684 RepID=UPI003D16481F